MSETNFSGVNFALKFKNYDPNQVTADVTINAVFVLDVSPSMDEQLQGSNKSRIDALNEGLNEFIAEMQSSHIKDSLFVSEIKFANKPEVVHGFRPIMDVQPHTLTTEGGSTALYDAVKEGIGNAMNYREQLEKTGINCKTLIFAITDGEDNRSGHNSANEVKSMIKDILKNEQNAFSFTSIIFGIGEDSSVDDAMNAMGFQHKASVGNTAKDIRKMINFISSSISSSASGKAVSTVNF